MIRLQIDNSVSSITGLSPEEFQKLRNILSYSEETRVGRSYKAYKRYLLSKRGTFPTGLIHYTDEFLKNKTVDLIDKRKQPFSRPGLFKMTLPPGVSLYKEQQEAVTACLREHQGCVSAPTGFGKSITLIALVNALQVRTLIVVPNLGLKKQLQESFRQCFGSLDNVTIENIDSPRLEKDGNYGCLIIDEAHRSAASTYRRLNSRVWNNIYYRFFFSASPFRSRDAELILMESVTGQVIYKVPHETAVSAGYIVPLESYFYDLPKQQMRGNPKSWPAVYSELVVENDYRNRLIVSLLKNLNDAGKSTLCLVKEIKHGRILQDLWGDNPPPFACGEDERTEGWIKEFNDRKFNVLIGTTGVLGEGIDSRPTEYCVLAGGGKAKVAFMQNCGRSFRRYPGKESAKVILFRDPSSKWLLEHFRECVKHLRDEYVISPDKLPLPEDLPLPTEPPRTGKRRKV